MTTNLKNLLRPRSVAVVGAAERDTSSGGAVLRNLSVSGFKGTVIPINPKGGTILGIPAKTSLAEVIPPADLAVIVIRPESILDAVREAAASGHKNLLVLPGGFAEAGEVGLARDAEMRRFCAEHGVRIAGPNCAGIIDRLDPTQPFAATFLRDMPRGGPVAFISQSGAIAEEVIAKSHELTLPFGAVISVGNAMHLGMTEYLEHYGDDPACKVITLYVESFGEIERFRVAARRIAKTKPILALVGGRTAEGVAAVKRHTGSAAMDSASLDRFFADAGVIRVETLRRLLMAAKGLGAHPAGLGERVLVLSNSGGPGVLTTDAAAREGLVLPALPAALAASLRGALPAEAAVANPLDLLADAREDRFGLVLEETLKHAHGMFDAILGMHVVPFMVNAAPVVARLAEIAAGNGVPMMHTMMGTVTGREAWFKTLEAAGIASFGDGEEMAVAAGYCARYTKLRATL